MKKYIDQTSTNVKINEEIITKWYENTIYQPFDFQITAIPKIDEALNNFLIPILAACPSAGKTMMSIIYTYFYLKANPHAKVLILTHGTKVLREQYFNVLFDLIGYLDKTQFNNEKARKEFQDIMTYASLIPSGDYKSYVEQLKNLVDDDKEIIIEKKLERIVEYKKKTNLKEILKSNNILISLPHTLQSAELSLNMFDLIIVDEAHHYYLAGTKTDDTGMMKKLLSKIKPKHQLLLTGSPSPFIRENHIANAKNLPIKYDIIPITVFDLYKKGRIADMIVEVARSKYGFNTNDFNVDGELKKDKVKTNKIETDSTLDVVLELIVKRLNSEYKDDPVKYYKQYYKGSNEWVELAKKGIKKIKLAKDFIIKKKTWNEVKKDWTGVLSHLKKTIIACKSQQQAVQVQKFLIERLGDKNKIALSVSDNDVNEKDRSEIDKFIQDDNCLVLIVVRRAILGFNLTELINVIDMTFSQNPDVIFQLFGRILRPHPDGVTKKLFIKIAPAALATWYTQLMVFVLSLCHKDFYVNFNGKNLYEMKVLSVKRITGGVCGTPPIPKPPIEVDEHIPQSKAPRVPDYSDLFSMLPDALDFFISIEMKSNDLLAGEAYTTMGNAYDDIFAHLTNKITRERFIELSMANPKNRERYEKRKDLLIENALQFATVESWKTKFPYAYESAIRENWLDDCTKHMN